MNLVFDGRPVPWARVKRGKHGNAYTPPKQDRHRQDLALMLKKAAQGKKWKGPVALNIIFDYLAETTEITLTESYYRTKPTRPDLDNLVKQVLEAIEDSGVIEDDKQVVFVSAKKV